jgi:hypothetical protein
MGSRVPGRLHCPARGLLTSCLRADSTVRKRCRIRNIVPTLTACVVGYHAFALSGFRWFTGGYVGVDVFFVISGYLISTIIFENLSSHTFSFGEF